MAVTFQHVHVKTRDVKKTMQYYINNFGATVKGEMPNGGVQLDLLGTQINITGIVATQHHAQSYGIEHMAVVTDDYPGTMQTLRGNGVRVLEELKGASGNRVAFVEGPDGSQMEIIEKA